MADAGSLPRTSGDWCSAVVSIYVDRRLGGSGRGILARSPQFVRMRDTR